MAIQSVLDVKDDTPPPKGLGNQKLFNRSILILTPARALKFTATTRERHNMWLTALSFLSHSVQSNDALALPPPLPYEIEYKPERTSLSSPKSTYEDMPSARARENITDHIMPLPEITNLSSRRPSISSNGTSQRGSHFHSSQPSDGSLGDFPSIPRTAHNRKRSNTAPRLPNLKHITSSLVGGSSNNSGSPSIGSFENYAYGSSNNTDGIFMENRVSYGPTGTLNGNFFEAVPLNPGTVTLTAFVDTPQKHVFDENDEYAKAPNFLQVASHGRSNSGRKGFVDYYGSPQHHTIKDISVDSTSLRHDPFRGF